MDIFGVGTSEIMVLALAALLIFGPGKLPEVMGQAGKWVRQFREMTAEYQGDFQKTIAEAKSAVDDLTKELGPMQQQVNSITSSVKKDLAATTGTTSTGASTSSTSGSEPAKPAGTATSRSATRTTVVSRSSGTTSTSTTSASTTTTSSTSADNDAASSPSNETGSMFEQPERTSRRRSRSVTPSAISDRAQRDDDDYEKAMAQPVTASVGEPGDNDALARVRRRRQSAGYNHARAI